MNLACCLRQMSARASLVAAQVTPDQHVRTWKPAPSQALSDVILWSVKVGIMEDCYTYAKIYQDSFVL